MTLSIHETLLMYLTIMHRTSPHPPASAECFPTLFLSKLKSYWYLVLICHRHLSYRLTHDNLNPARFYTNSSWRAIRLRRLLERLFVSLWGAGLQDLHVLKGCRCDGSWRKNWRTRLWRRNKRSAMWVKLGNLNDTRTPTRRRSCNTCTVRQTDALQLRQYLYHILYTWEHTYGMCTCHSSVYNVNAWAGTFFCFVLRDCFFSQNWQQKHPVRL